MNLVDAFVKKVISGPYEEYGKWLDWPPESPDNQYHLFK